MPVPAANAPPACGGLCAPAWGGPASRTLSRVLAAGLVGAGLLLVPRAATARGGPGSAVRAWLSDLVTRIDAADRADRRTPPGRRTGTVLVHVEIAADGSLQRADIERGSGSPDLDLRALRAVEGALRGGAPGTGRPTAPPAALLGLAETVDLSIPVELGR